MAEFERITKLSWETLNKIFNDEPVRPSKRATAFRAYEQLKADRSIRPPEPPKAA